MVEKATGNGAFGGGGPMLFMWEVRQTSLRDSLLKGRSDPAWRRRVAQRVKGEGKNILFERDTNRLRVMSRWTKVFSTLQNKMAALLEGAP